MHCHMRRGKRKKKGIGGAAHGGQEAVGGGVQAIGGRAVLEGRQRRGGRALLEEVPRIVERQPGRDAPPLRAPPAPRRTLAARTTDRHGWMRHTSRMRLHRVHCDRAAACRCRRGRLKPGRPLGGGGGVGVVAPAGPRYSSQPACPRSAPRLHAWRCRTRCSSAPRLRGRGPPCVRCKPAAAQVQHHARHQSIACCQQHRCARVNGRLGQGHRQKAVCHPLGSADVVTGEAHMQEWATRRRALGGEGKKGSEGTAHQRGCMPGW